LATSNNPIIFNRPKALLARVVELEGDPIGIALCPDFENTQWRHKALVEHLFDWLPETALRADERLALRDEPNKLLARAAIRVFKETDPSKRGELGEIILHAVCRQEFGTLPVIPRLFYKMRSNDQVTGVDVVHLTYDDTTDQLDLWLGEAKLYDNLRGAKYSALTSVKGLWDALNLAEMKALVGPKIEPTAPYAEKLRWLFEEETSLDQIVDRIVIPICLAVDFDPTKKASDRSLIYLEEVKAALTDVREYYKKRIPKDVRFVCIFVPLDDKAKLEERMLKKLESYQ
jgi:hypothetical protein